MNVLRTIEKARLDPNYIFMELSDNDILQSEKYGHPFLLQHYGMISTFILFDTTRIKVFCISCGSRNNYIKIRRDTNGLLMGSSFQITSYRKNRVESPINMNPVSREYSTLNLLSKKLNFSIDHLTAKLSRMILRGYLTDSVIRYVTRSNKIISATVSSSAIVTGEFQLTIFTLPRLDLYTVLLPFDGASWSYLSAIIFVIITFIIVYNRLNYDSAKLIILWMLRNILEQDDSTTTKKACGSKTITKYIVILWSLCSMFIGWSYKGCVSSEISIKFPSSIPNSVSVQEILNMNMTIITIAKFVSFYGNNTSYLHNLISDLLDKKNAIDFSPEYLQFLSSLSREVQYLDLDSLDQLECSFTQRITRLRNSSSVLDSWSMINFKTNTKLLIALMYACSNFTSINIPSNPNKFPTTVAWIGYSNIFFKIFSSQLSIVTQSGVYDYWQKDFTRKSLIVDLKKLIKSLKRNSTSNIQIKKGKAALRKLITGVDLYEKPYQANPITLTNVHMPLVAFGGCFMHEIQVFGK